MSRNRKIGRRDVLKAMTGIPVLGIFGIGAFKKIKYDAQHDARKKIVQELGLEDLLSNVKQVTHTPGDLVRIGMIGYGVRGHRR
jgi:hypothetical protein